MKYLNYDKVVLLSVGFLLLFATFYTASGLAGKVLAENDFGQHGFYSLSVLYFVFTIFCLFADQIVTRVGIKRSIVIGSLAYAFYCSTFILSSYAGKHPEAVSRWFIIFLLYLSAALMGPGSAMLWVAEGEYISNCANDYNKGLFMSTFRAIYMSSNIFGYLFSAFVIGIISNMYVFFSILTGLSLIASFVFLFLQTPTPQPVSVSSFDAENEVKEQQSVAETIKLYFSSRMMALQGLFLASGFNISMSTLFIPLMCSHMEAMEITKAKKD